MYRVESGKFVPVGSARDLNAIWFQPPHHLVALANRKVELSDRVKIGGRELVRAGQATPSRSCSKIPAVQGEVMGAGWVATYKFEPIDAGMASFDRLAALARSKVSVDGCAGRVPTGLAATLSVEATRLCPRDRPVLSRRHLCEQLTGVGTQPSDDGMEVALAARAADRRIAEAVVSDVIAQAIAGGKDSIEDSCADALAALGDIWPPPQPLHESWLRLVTRDLLPRSAADAKVAAVHASFGCVLAEERLSDCPADALSLAIHRAAGGDEKASPSVAEWSRVWGGQIRRLPVCYASVVPALAAVAVHCPKNVAATVLSSIDAYAQGEGGALLELAGLQPTPARAPSPPIAGAVAGNDQVSADGLHLIAGARFMGGARWRVEDEWSVSKTESSPRQPHLPLLLPVGVGIRHDPIYFEIAPLDLGQYVTGNGRGGVRKPRTFDGFAPNMTLGLVTKDNPFFAAGLSAGFARLDDSDRYFFAGVSAGIVWSATELSDADAAPMPASAKSHD